MHVATLAVAEPGVLAEDFGSHPLQVETLGNGHVVWSVGRRDGVTRLQVRHGSDRHWLLSRSEMHLAGQLTSADVERG